MARKVEPDAIEYRTADGQAACPLVTASASARPARRGRRTWHVRTLSVREPGDLTAGQQRRSVCCTGPCREDRVLDRMSKNVALYLSRRGDACRGFRYWSRAAATMLARLDGLCGPRFARPSPATPASASRHPPSTRPLSRIPIARGHDLVAARWSSSWSRCWPTLRQRHWR
jgi:hypothetical protein